MSMKTIKRPPAKETANPSPLPELQPLFPAAVLHILEAPDRVDVMTVDPEPIEEDQPGLFHGYRVRGIAQVRDNTRCRAVGQALVAANRTGLGWSLCFDPDYAVRLTRGEQTVALVICFWCANVHVIGPGEHASSYPIGRTARRVLNRELRRAGVGWLWFWRRWLP
jgi:hypothetical protein